MATLSIATDKSVYAPGETVTLTATYTDETGVNFTVHVAAHAADTETPPNTADATTAFTVSSLASTLMALAVSDDHGDVWAQVSNVPGTAVFSTSAPAT